MYLIRLLSQIVMRNFDLKQSKNSGRIFSLGLNQVEKRLRLLHDIAPDSTGGERLTRYECNFTVFGIYT